MIEARLTLGQSRACMAIAIAFAAAAAFRLAIICAAALAPQLMAVTIACDRHGCAAQTAPLNLLPDDVRALAETRPDPERVLQDHLGSEGVRQVLLAGQMVIDLPVIGLLLSVAWGIWALGRTEGRALDRSVPWLRRGAWFALIAVMAVPLGQALQTTQLAQAFDPDAAFALRVNLGRWALNLLLALVALAVSWALAAGLRAEQDLAEIV